MIKSQTSENVQNEQEQNIPETTETETSAGEEKKEQPDYLDQLKRLQADFINYKRRMEKMQAEWGEVSVRNVVNELLPIIDDFDYLFHHNVDDQGHLPMDGVKMIYDKMYSVLQKLGVEDVPTQNELFDPQVHEAVRMEKNTNVEPGTILQVWQRGYMLNGKLLRPARVMVAEESRDE